jgi:hypothetical protein
MIREQHRQRATKAYYNFLRSRKIEEVINPWSENKITELDAQLDHKAVL